uniref:Transmembrane protein n=1 Tax=Rhodopseudomonas palustris (strain DX-1) TaxID=652103 RepID=E6VKR8_RHOPX
MSIIGFPLLLIPVAICNIIVFLMPGLGFDAALARVALPSGATWTIALGDVLVALGVLLLLPEVMKAARPGAKYLTDHLLSLLVLGGTVAEFVMLPQFANQTVFVLAMLALVDFLSGVALRSRHQSAARAGQPAKRRGKAVQPIALPEDTTEAPAPALPASELSPQTAEPTSAATTAASMAEAVLLDRPEPVKAAGSQAVAELAKAEEKSPAR